MSAACLVVFDPSGSLEGSLTASLARHPELPVLLRSASDWATYAEALAGAPLPIVILDGGVEQELLRRLIFEANRRPAAIIVLVGAPGTGPMLELRQLGVGCVVDHNISVSRWQALLRRAVGEQQMSRLTDLARHPPFVNPPEHAHGGAPLAASA